MDTNIRSVAQGRVVAGPAARILMVLFGIIALGWPGIALLTLASPPS
jgi:hypothetical protein